MKRTALLIITALVLAGASLSAQSDSALLAQIDNLILFNDSDYSAEYTITEERPGQGTTVRKAVMFRRDSEDKFLLLVLEPAAERGKAYLKIGNNLWLYDPVSRRFTVTSARERFLNSGVNIADFTQSSLAEDYRIVSQTREQLGAYNTRVLELEATNDGVAYPYRKLWIDENNLLRKAEDYSLSRQLMRTVAIPRYTSLDNRYAPSQIVVIDALQGGKVDGVFRNNRTIITVAKGSLDDVPDLVFTQAYLERLSD